ncbi:iron ABC transporter permease, partial [Burkholderia contaminans]
RRRELNALMSGDVAAAALGVPSARMRREVFVVASFATGAMVAVSGAIGFVGLVTPHLCRRVVGAEHGRLLPVAALTGAILLVWADVAARTLAAPEDLPIGIVTAMFGSLFFVALLRRR